MHQKQCLQSCIVEDILSLADFGDTRIILERFVEQVLWLWINEGKNVSISRDLMLNWCVRVLRKYLWFHYETAINCYDEC